MLLRALRRAPLASSLRRARALRAYGYWRYL